MSNLAQDFRALLGGRQQGRILTLSFPHADAPASVLLANRLEGTEALSRDFEFTVEILSDNASLALKDFIGKMLSVQLVRSDGSLRYFNGYVFAFRHVKTDGGIAHYEAQIGPWLRYLKLRRNSRLFLDQNLHTQTTTLLGDYGVLPVWDWRVHGEDPSMTMACQYNEDDHNYLSRRWETAGYLYWYEHTRDGHKLVVTDTSADAAQIDGPGAEVRFQSEAGSQEEDGIATWTPVRQMMPTHVARSRFDFKNPRPATVDMPTVNKQGSVPQLEDYQYAGAYGFKPGQDGDDVVRRRMEEIEAAAKHFDGEGNSRYAMPGRWFRLTDHYGSAVSGDASKSEFLIVSVRHTVSNNYLQGTETAAEYSNAITCIRRSIPWRPGLGYDSVDTRILAPQTATVVGPSGQSVYTDQYGRCKLQFHWDRDAKGDETSSTWVRVASSWSGGEQGAAAPPRIGSEVIVQWLEGNPDRPIVTGRVANEKNMPSWQLPSQSALMGFRSRELDGASGNIAGGRSNHLLFDDTAQQIQTQLRSDHENSQLSLGYVTRIENTAGRQDARGEGFELRTDAVGAIRSGKGMLISTDPRPQAKSHLSDVSEPVDRLGKAQTLHGQLGKLAQQYQAQDSGADQSSIADALKTQNDAIKGSGGTVSGSGSSNGGSFPEFNDPHLVVASPAGVAITTPGSSHLASGQHVAVTSGENVSIAAGKSLLASVSEKFSLFVHKLGIKLIAASGKVQVRAENDELELLAKKVVSLISTTDWINITAKQGIKLTAGNSQFVISADGLNGFTPGSNLIHAGSHSTMGPQSIPVQFPGADLCSSLSSGAAQAGNASIAL